MPLVAGIAMVSAAAYVVVLAVADLVERAVDPRSTARNAALRPGAARRREPGRPAGAR
jgi:peptide/nickel transport system permease protein